MRTISAVRRSGVVIAVAALALAGCGGGGGGDDAQRDDISDMIVDQLDEADIQISDDEAHCIVESLEDEDYTLDEIEETFDAEDAPAEFQELVFTSLGECAEDLNGLVSQFVVLAGQAADPPLDISQADAECIVEYIDETGYDNTKFIIDAINASSELEGLIDEAADECGVDGASGGSSSGSSGTSGEPMSYGDDPELDDLYDACDEGDLQACDDLFFDSPFGSEYEEFGDTCGGLQPDGGGYCVNLRE